MSVDLLHAVKELREYERFHQIQMYEPYPKQLEFHHALGKGTERLADQRGLIAANRVGKTFSAAMETAYHATGLYPEWWEGHTFPEGIDIVCAGVSNDLTRDIVQKALLGPPDDPDAQGSGTIPREAIVECVRKPGVPMAFQSIIVRHISGKNSVIKLMAY